MLKIIRKNLPTIALRLVLISIFFALVSLVIAYARGYRFDFQNKKFSSTGIISVSAYPKAAKVYVNGKLEGATDLNLTVPYGTYKIEVKKEGYTTWTREITVKGELVVTLDALLFPVNPSLAPLSNVGILKAIPVNGTDKIVLFADNGDELKDGVYLFEASKNPLSLLPPLKLLMLKTFLPLGVDLKNTSMYFSPDYKQAILDMSLLENQTGETISFLISLEEENVNQFDITLSKTTLLEAWDEEKQANKFKILETFKKDIVKVASDSFDIVAFSPDETKFLYHVKNQLEVPVVIKPRLISTNQTPEVREVKPGGLYVYDRKEDRNYKLDLPYVADLIENSQVSSSFAWYPDSKHLVIKEVPTRSDEGSKEKIVVIDFDGMNKQTVYSGPFDRSFFKAASDGRIVIMTSFNPDTNPTPDLYAVGIK